MAVATENEESASTRLSKNLVNSMEIDERVI